ncbi:MAG: hypothetical protein ABIH25_04375 [Candidatus Woesearchaeota archaeon]
MISGLDALCQVGTEPKRKLPEHVAYGGEDSGRYNQKSPREIAYMLHLAQEVNFGLENCNSDQINEMLASMGFPADDCVVLYVMEPETNWQTMALNALRHARRNRIEIHEVREGMKRMPRGPGYIHCLHEVQRMKDEITEADKKLTQATDSVLAYGARTDKAEF